MNVNELIGIPFKWGGSDIEGCDCWGLARLYYRGMLGIELPDHDEVLRSDEGAVAKAFVDEKQHWKQTTDEVRCGDLILIRLDGVARHVGVCVGPGLMLHTDYGFASQVERYGSLKWGKRIVGFFRHASLA